MIRKLLATTAIITLVSTGAYAQTTPPATTMPAPPAPAVEAPAAAPAMKMDGHLASNIIGENVYNGDGDKAEKIGDVNDIVLSQDGSAQSLVVGVGGFLGLGEKNVAISFNDFKWSERNGDRYLVINATADALKSQPDFDRSAYDPAPAKTASEPAAAPSTMAQAPATAPAPAATPAPATDATKTGAIDRSTLKDLPADKMRSEELVGTTVYGADDTNVGEVGDVIVSQDGKVDAVILDVGGFLGVGEKEVAVGMQNLKFLTDGNGNTYLYTGFTKDQLNAAAAYDEKTFAEKRGDQLLTAPTVQ